MRQREHLVVDHHGEAREGGDEGRGESLKPGIQVAVLAGEIVAGIAHGGIDGILAEMLGRVDDQVPAIADKIVLRAWPELGDVDGVPIFVDAPEIIAGCNAAGGSNGEQDDDQKPLQHVVEILWRRRDAEPI